MESVKETTAGKSGVQYDTDNVWYLDQALWRSFAESRTIEQMCPAWLALQCRIIPGVERGLVVLVDKSAGSRGPAATWPDDKHGSAALADIAEAAIRQGKGAVRRNPGTDAGGRGLCDVAWPIEVNGTLLGVVAMEANLPDDAALKGLMRQLQWGVSWFEVIYRRTGGKTLQTAHDRLTRIFDCLAVVLGKPDFNDAVTALVTHLATVTDCDRVSLGLRRGGHTRLAAMSHSAQTGARMNLVRLIGSAMDEAIDQGGPVFSPPREDDPVMIGRQNEMLRRNHGGGAVLSAPLTAGDRVLGALTFERREGRAFDAEEADLCRGVAVLLAPLLEDKRLAAQGWHQVAWRGLRNSVTNLWGGQHVGAKIISASLAAALVAAALIPVEFQISADTELEARFTRAVVAPFDGYVASADVRAGDHVNQGAVMFTLDDRELRLDQLRWSSQRQQLQRQYKEALAVGDRVQSQVIKAQIDQAEAQLQLINTRLARATVTAPLDGMVIEGDLSQELGAPTTKGATLFAVAPLDGYRVILKIDQRDIDFISVGQQGAITLESMPTEPLEFSVQRITPVTEADEGRTFFRVEASLEEEASGRLRPGMEGIGKVRIGEQSLLWIVTRDLVDWLRLAAWRWLP